MRRKIYLFILFLIVSFFLLGANTFALEEQFTKYNFLYEEAQKLSQNNDKNAAKEKIYKYINTTSVYGCKGYSLLGEIFPSENKIYSELFSICQALRKYDRNNIIFNKEQNNFEGIEDTYLGDYLYFSLSSHLSGIQKSFQYDKISLLEGFLNRKNKNHPFYTQLLLLKHYLKKETSSFNILFDTLKQQDIFLIHFFFIAKGYLNNSFSFEDGEKILTFPTFKLYLYDSYSESYRYMSRIVPKNDNEIKKYIQYTKPYKQKAGDVVLYSQILSKLKSVKNIDTFKTELIDLGGKEYFNFFKNALEIQNFILEKDDKILTSSKYSNIQSSLSEVLDYYTLHRKDIELGYSPWNYLETQIYTGYSKLFSLREKGMIKITPQTLEVAFKNKEILEEGWFQIYKDDAGKIIFNPMTQRDKENYLAGIKKKELAEKYNKFYSGAIGSGAEVPNPYIVKDTIPEALDIKVVKKEINDVQSQKNKYYFFLFLSFIGGIIALGMILRTKNS